MNNLYKLHYRDHGSPRFLIGDENVVLSIYGLLETQLYRPYTHFRVFDFVTCIEIDLEHWPDALIRTEEERDIDIYKKYRRSEVDLANWTRGEEGIRAEEQ